VIDIVDLDEQLMSWALPGLDAREHSRRFIRRDRELGTRWQRPYEAAAKSLTG
jgi:hypothetical protein